MVGGGGGGDEEEKEVPGEMTPDIRGL